MTSSIAANTSTNNTKCNLILGWHHWPPFQYLDENAQPAGIQIEFIKTLANETNCNIQFIKQPFEQNQESLKRGEIDLTLDITQTDERKEYGYFSVPYRKEILVLYVRSQFLEQCRSQKLAELINKGFRLSLTKGVIYGDSIKAIQNDPSLEKRLHYQTSNDSELTLLKAGQLDGILEDPIVMAYSKRMDPSLSDIESCQITVYSGMVSIMFSKKTVSTALVQRFNAAIAKLLTEPEFFRLLGW